MRHNIDQRKVRGVIAECNQILTNKSFSQAEVILGLQELVGRTIVEMSQMQTGADELVKFAKRHLDDTVRIGMEARSDRAFIQQLGT